MSYLASMLYFGWVPPVFTSLLLLTFFSVLGNCQARLLVPMWSCTPTTSWWNMHVNSDNDKPVKSDKQRISYLLKKLHERQREDPTVLALPGPYHRCIVYRYSTSLHVPCPGIMTIWCPLYGKIADFLKWKSIELKLKQKKVNR